MEKQNGGSRYITSRVLWMLTSGTEKKLNWLKTRLTGHAQTAFQHLPVEVKGDFDEERCAEATF